MATISKGEGATDLAREFCRLCREGRLFEAEAWLKERKPAKFEHKNVRCTPLGIAIDRNFHSLAEILLRNDFSPEPRHLWMAVRHKRAGILELLLQGGADIRWLDFAKVVLWPHPEILRLLIRLGADTYSGYPMAEGLKRAPRAFLGIYKDFLEQHPTWIFQANMALRHFCYNGSIQGVCLLLWAGADPRAKVPEKADEDEDMWQSALWHACINGHVQVVKKIGPSREKDDLDELLRLACSGQNVQLIEYLVGLGANLNAVPANGETALRSALWAIEWRIDFDRHEPCRHQVQDALSVLKTLVALGARLNSAESDELSFLRRCLLKLDWVDSYDLVKFLHQHQFTDDFTMTALLKEPKVRKHFEKRLQALSRMFPALKRWAPS